MLSVKVQNSKISTIALNEFLLKGIDIKVKINSDSY